jgi:ankyrin repeat protein
MTFNEILDLMKLNPFTSEHEEQIYLAIKKDPVLLQKTDKKGNTILLWAAYYGKIAIYDYLVSTYNLPSKQKNMNDNSALLLAAANGQCDMFAHLVNYYGFHSTATNPTTGNSALLWAAVFGKIEMFDFLVSTYHLDIKQTNYQLMSALLLAAANDQIEMLDHLEFRHKLDIKATDENGHSALLQAIKNGKIAMLDHLVDKYRFDPKSNEFQNMQAATACKQVKMVQHLKTKYGCTESQITINVDALDDPNVYPVYEIFAKKFISRFDNHLQDGAGFDWNDFSRNAGNDYIPEYYLNLIKTYIDKTDNESANKDILKCLIPNGVKWSIISLDNIFKLLSGEFASNLSKLSLKPEKSFLIRKYTLQAIIEKCCKETALTKNDAIDTQTTLLENLQNIQSQPDLNNLISHCIDQINIAISRISPFNSSRRIFKEELEKFKPILCPEVVPIPIDIQWVAKLKQKLTEEPLKEKKAKVVTEHVKTFLSKFPNASQLYVGGKPANSQVPLVNEERACANYAKVLLLNNNCWNEAQQTQVPQSSANSSASFSLLKFFAPTSLPANISTPQPAEKSKAEKDVEIIVLLDESLKYSDYCYLPALIERKTYIDLKSRELKKTDIKFFIHLNLEIFFHPLSTAKEKLEANYALIKLQEFPATLTPEEKEKIDIVTLDKISHLSFVNLEERSNSGELIFSELGEETSNNFSENLRKKLGYKPKYNQEISNVFLEEVKSDDLSESQGIVRMPDGNKLVEEKPSAPVPRNKGEILKDEETISDAGSVPDLDATEESLDEPQKTLTMEAIAAQLKSLSKKYSIPENITDSDFLPSQEEQPSEEVVISALSDVMIQNAEIIAALTKEKDSLTGENASLKAVVPALKEKNSLLESKNAALQEELAKYKSAMASMVSLARPFQVKQEVGSPALSENRQVLFAAQEKASTSLAFNDSVPSQGHYLNL